MSTVQGAPVLEAARRARQHATVVASLAAVVPTVLAAQGMAALAMDVLGFSLIAAVALAGFLELALISSALLARASALAGRPGAFCVVHTLGPERATVLAVVPDAESVPDREGEATEVGLAMCPADYRLPSR